MSHPIPFGGGGSFTVDGLQEMLLRQRGHPGYILTDRYQLPSREKLAGLAWALNDIAGAFRFVSTVGKRANPQADRVRGALEILTIFFEERRRECLKKKYDAETIESERKLYNAFGKFLRTLDKHSFGLDMDMVLMMANLEGWHDIALVIAEAFKVAMSANRIEPLGIANEGPVARFVAAVIPSITGEAPTPGAVSQHLKRCAGARSGTNGK